MTGLAPTIRQVVTIGILLASLILSFPIAAETRLAYPPAYHSAPIVKRLNTAIASIDAPDQTIIIALGPSSLTQQLNLPHSQNTVFLALLIERKEFKRIQRAHPGKTLSAIFLDPSPEALLALSHAIFSSQSTVALPYYHASPFVDDAETLAQSLPLNTNIELVKTSSSKQWLRKLNTFHGVIASPDSDLFSLSNIQAITRSLYRQRKALIGYSKEMTEKHGALASVYTSDAQLVEDTIVRLHALINQPNVPLITHPAKYRVRLNATLAKSLGFFHLDESSLEARFNTTLTNNRQGQPGVSK